METILLMGASLVEYGYHSHWVSRLADFYARKAVVYNAGLAGYSTDWLLKIMKDERLSEKLVPPFVKRPLFVTLMLGSNDCSHFKQHVPRERYKRNLMELVKLIQQRYNPKLGVILLTIPPIDEVRWPLAKGMNTTDRTFADSLDYRNAMVEVVLEMKQKGEGKTLYLIDIFSSIRFYGDPQGAVDALGNAPGGTQLDTIALQSSYHKDAIWTRLLYDGLHVNESGGEIFFTSILNFLRKIKVNDAHAAKLKYLPEELEYVFPTYTDILSGKRSLESKL